MPTNSTVESWGPRSLTELANYRYRVKARYQWNGYTSNWSNGNNWTTAANFQMPECPPAAVTNLSVQQLNIQSSSTSMNVDWDPPPPGIGTVLGYHVQRRKPSESWPSDHPVTGQFQCNGSITFCDYATLERGQLYEYRVRAYKSTVQGPWTVVSHTTLYATPSAPGTPTFSAVAPYGYTVNWNNVANANTGAINYELWEKIGTNPGTWADKDGATSQGLSNKSPATIYEYEVRACNGNNPQQCAESAASTISFPGTPGAITVNNISNFGRDYRLNWTAASGTVSTFRLEQSTDNGQNWSQLLDQNVLLLQISNATAGTGYQYRVRAHNSTADGQYTSVFNYWVPQTPTNLGGSANAAAPSLNVTWTGNALAHHYELQQSTDGGQNWGSVISISGTSHSPSGVSNGIDYTYRVRACNLQSACSPYTGAVTIRLPYVTPAVPAAPSINVNSSAGTLSANWTAVSGYVQTYKAEQSTDGGSTWSLVQNTSALSYAPTNLTTGLTYRLRIAACNVDACSNFGASASAYLPHATPPLPNLSTGGFIGVIDNVPTYGAGHVGEYTVTWSSAGGVVNTLTAQEQEPGGAWQAASVTALSCGTSPDQCSYNKPPNNSGALQVYRYRAQACNSDNCSAWKEIAVQVNFYITPGIPASFTISQGPTTAGAYTLRWTRPSGSAELHYYYLDNSDTPTNPDYPSIPHDPNQAYFEHAFTGGVSGQTYNYRVRACYLDDNGCDAYTAPLAVYIPYPAPGQPGALSHSGMNASTGSYTLNWSAASGQVSNYELQRQLADGQWVAEASTASTSHAITGQANGETRGYRVRACNIDACGNYTAAYAVYVPHLTPDVPSSLVLQNLNAAGQSLNLGWTAPGSGGVVQSYEMQQSTNGGSTWQAADSTASVILALSGLVNGTTYHFRVRACNADACSSYSTSLQVYLPYTAPGTPGALNHDADENNPAAGAFTVHWTAPSTIVSAISPINHYRIDYSANGGSTWQAAPTGGTIPGRINVTNPAPNAAAAATLSGLATAASYSVRVRACNDDACGSNTVPYQAYLPNPPPGAPVLSPTNPSAADHTARRFTVQWTAPATGTVHHYQIESDAGVINGLQTWLAVVETPAISYTFTDRAYGETYRYRVRACSEAQSTADYCGAWATTANIRLKYPTPNAPGGLAVGEVDQTTGNYTLNWNGVLGWAPEYRYELAENLNSSGVWQSLTTTLVDPAHEYAITGRGAGTHKYRIRACNPAPDTDCSVWSPEATVIVLPTPTAPASLIVDDGDGESCQFNVDWTPPTGGLGTYHYQLEVQVNGGSWSNLAWTPGTSHNLMVNPADSNLSRIFRVRARTLSNSQYSPWGAWNTGSSVTTSCDHDQLVAHDGLYISAPRYSESGQYTVITQYVESWAPGLETRHMVSTNNGASWGLLGWVQPPNALNITYNSSTARPTARYVYAAGVCDADLVYDPDPNYVCWSGYTDPPWELLTTNTTVLRDPGSVGTLQVPGLPNPIDGAYIAANGQFTLSWSTAPNPAGPATHKYEIQYKRDTSSSADAWMVLSEQTATSIPITLPEFGIAFDYRVRACAHLDDYVNCDNWSELTFPVKQSMGAPRMAVNSYPVDGELVIYDKRVPLQWLPPWDMAESGIHHYEISLRSKQIDGAEEHWVGPDVLSTPAPVNGPNSNPPVQQALVEVEQSGAKKFLIRACGTTSPTSCGAALEFDITVLVPPEPPAEPTGLAGEVHPDSYAGSQFNGALSGEFSVQPSGAAGYTLPIIMPPGTAGMQPKLSLDYSSQGGNGVVGLGWSISGLSAISRCNKTLAQDGEIHGVDYTSNDAYCLDGQRLIQIASNTYRTEKNDFSRITKISGGVCGTWFEVKTQAGQTLQYGNTADSCINVIKTNSSNVIYGWALNKTTDVAGNYITYKYEENTANGANAFAIDRIEYTGHTSSDPYTAVDFKYDTGRPDPLVGFHAGVGMRQERRLVRITTGVDPNDTSNDPAGYGEYRLTYSEDGDELSRLTSVEYCATINASEQCMRPLEFQWNTWQAGWERLSGYNPPRAFADRVDSNPDLGARMADLDNDGLPDLLYAGRDGRYAYRNTGTGWQSHSAWEPPVDFVNDEGEDLGVQLVDITGDGVPEILTSQAQSVACEWVNIYQVCAPDSFKVYRLNSSGTDWIHDAQLALPLSFTRFTPVLQGHGIPPLFELAAGSDNGLRLADLDGDGLVDLIYGGPEDDPFHPLDEDLSQAWRNTGNNSDRWEPWPDYDPPVRFTARRETVTDWPLDEPYGFEDEAYENAAWFADYDGDGLTDLMYKIIPHPEVYGGPEDEYLEYRVRLNTGTGWASDSRALTVMLDIAGDGPDAGVRLVDLNGDGLPDFMHGNNSNDVIKYNTGTGWASTPFGQTPKWQEGSGGIYTRYINRHFLDLNYDGRTDVLVNSNDGGWLSSHEGWQTRPQYATPFHMSDLDDDFPAITRFLDVNGDGRTDLLRSSASSSANGAWTQRSGRRHITGVTDGLGNTTEIKYKGLLDKRLDGRTHPLYSRTSASMDVPDEREANMGMQVISQVIVDDGIGGELVTEYAYKGLTATIGRGLQGFESMTAYKPDGTVAITEYARHYPYTGLPLAVKISYGEGSGAKLLERTEYEYCHAITSAATTGYASNPETAGFTSTSANCGEYEDSEGENEAIFIFPKQTTTVKNLLSDNLQSITATVTTVTDNTYGVFGYLSQSLVTTTGDGHTYTAETNNDYVDSNPEWRWLGKMEETSSIRRIDGATDANSTRVVAYEYHANSWLKKKKVEPGAGAPDELHTVYEYDEYGNIVETTVCATNTDIASCAANPSSANAGGPGRSITTVYDSQGRYPVESINALDQTETREYQHPLGMQTKLTGPNGLETTWTYDKLGRKLSETNPFGTTTIAYRTANVSGYVPGAEYSVQTNAPGSAPARVYYDAKGRERRTLGQNLHGEYVAVDTEYDEFGRVWRKSRPYFEYATTAGDAHWTVNYYDDLGRLSQVDVPLGDINSDGVDDGVAINTSGYNGFATITTDAKGRRTRKEQNALGQTVRSIDDLDDKNIPVAYTYDSQGNLTSTTVDNNPSTAIVLTHDKRGNKISMDDPDMGEWEYEYNGFGELVRQTDAKGQVTEIDYDKLGRMVERREWPDENNDGILETVQTSTFVYDTASGAGIGKLHIEEGAQGDSKEYFYTSRGQLEQTEYNLDVNGWTQNFVVSQTYDSFGRVQLISYPEVGGERLTVENNYSSFGGLWYVLDAGDPLETGDESVYWIADMVDARGRLLQETLRNQNTISSTTNTANGWLLKVESWDKDLNMIQQSRYTFDEVGNMQTRERFRPWIVNPDGSFQAGENEEVVEAFTFDSLDRLLSSTVTRDGVPENDKSNDYDRLGNFLYKDDSANLYGYGACNAGLHAVCTAGGTSFTYDANGNMVESTGAKERTVEYSAFNKPTQITENGATVYFAYGADRARVFKQSLANGQTQITWYVGLGAEGAPVYEQTATVSGGQIVKREHLQFLYAGGHHGGQAFAVRVLEEDEDNNASQPNFIRYSGTEYYHRDHLGSVIAITGDTGSVEETRLLSFDAWGKRRNSDWSEGGPDAVDQYTPEGMRGNLAYTGHEAVPEVGLIHMNGRVYDPELGVFMSADPEIQEVGNTQNYNRYSYVLNNPLRYTDPSGFNFLERISPSLATFISIALNFIPGCQGWCSALFNMAYAKANGMDTGDAMLGAAISFFAGGIGGSIGGPMGAMVGGAISGALTAHINGQDVSRGAFQGAIMALAFYHINKAVQKSTSAMQPTEAPPADNPAEPQQSGQGGPADNKKVKFLYDDCGIAYSDEVERAPFLEDFKVTSDVGPRTHPITKAPSVHGGADMVPLNSDGSVDHDALVVSVSEGKVLKIGPATGFGPNTVVIETPKGNQIIYGHMQLANDNLQVGDQVHAGTILGIVGNEGVSDGTHLHLEIRQGNTPFTGLRMRPQIIYNQPSNDVWMMDELF